MLAIGSQAAALALPWLPGSVVEAIDDGDRPPAVAVAIVVAVGVARALMMVGRRLISGKQALAVELDMRNARLREARAALVPLLRPPPDGQLMSRATVDLQAVRFFLGYGLIFFAQHVFTIVGVEIVVFFISWKLALIMVAIRPALVAVAYRYSQVSHPVLRDVQQRLADVATVAEENIVGVHVVKSFAQEQAEQDKFERRSEARLRAERQREAAAGVLRAGAVVPAAARAGGGAARRRADGRERVAVARRLRRASTSSSRC